MMGCALRRMEPICVWIHSCSGHEERSGGCRKGRSDRRVLVHQGRVLGRGHTGECAGSAVLHGEMDALERAGRQSGQVYRSKA